MTDRTIRYNLKKMTSDVARRFAASSESKKIMKDASSGNRLKDIMMLKRVSALNKAIKDKAVKHVADTMKTRNNELAKSIGLYAVPVTAIAGGTALANKIYKRKGENNMEKMSAEQYTEFIDKLAEEILEDQMEVEASEDYEDVENFDEDAENNLDEETLAKRAYAAYEAAQMQKEAAENDYATASAYEDAALQIMDELGLLED